MGDRPDERQAFQIEQDRQARLDFGHYAGRTIAELAVIDPDYLRWLERHPSGARYRAEIHRVLGVVPLSTDWRR